MRVLVLNRVDRGRLNLGLMGVDWIYCLQKGVVWSYTLLIFACTCALAWFQTFEKSAVNGMLFRGLHLNREIILLMLVWFVLCAFFGGFWASNVIRWAMVFLRWVCRVSRHTCFVLVGGGNVLLWPSFEMRVCVRYIPCVKRRSDSASL